MKKRLICLLLVFILTPAVFADSNTSSPSPETNPVARDNFRKLREGDMFQLLDFYRNGTIVFKFDSGKIIYTLDDLTVSDAWRFRFVEGLADKNLFSIESVEKPGFYWSVWNDRINLKKVNKKDQAACKDATFKLHPSLFTPRDETKISIESFSHPEHFAFCGWGELFLKYKVNSESFQIDTSIHTEIPPVKKFHFLQYLFTRPVITILLFLIMGTFFLFSVILKPPQLKKTLFTLKITLLKRDIPLTWNTIMFSSFFLLLFLILTYTITKNAWINDDSFITFRTIDNFVNGYGLTWNTSERVQVYTHPLWMLLLSIFYFFTREIYLTTIVISIIFSLTAVFIISTRISKTRLYSLLLILVLTYSKAFIEYATSGLENPLSYVCLAFFFMIYFSDRISGRNDVKILFFLSLTASLGIVTRLDLSLLFLPPLIYKIIIIKKWKKGVPAVLLGFIPLILWELFSLIYYGFLFPNTYYAKLGTGIPVSAFIPLGLDYIYMALKTDPLTIVFIFLGVIVPFVLLKKDLIPISIGIVLSLIYIVRIGGCFMTGRFFTTPLLCALIILSQIEIKIMKWAYLPGVSLVLLTGLFSLHTILFTQEYDDQFKFYSLNITNERVYFLEHTGMRKRKNVLEPLTTASAEYGREIRAKGKQVVTRDGVGIEGFYAGPEVHIIDQLALCDAFLSRIYCSYIDKDVPWTMGHFRRELPDGYLQTIITGTNRITDSELKSYYDKLSILIKGNIFNVNRFLEIVKMNIGLYDSLLKNHNMRILEAR